MRVVCTVDYGRKIVLPGMEPEKKEAKPVDEQPQPKKVLPKKPRKAPEPEFIPPQEVKPWHPCPEKEWPKPIVQPWHPWPVSDGCTLTKPLMMVIPYHGTNISCPVHGSHFIRGSGVHW